MAATTTEEVLLTTRTHPKVLFVPALVQLLLIAAHVLTGVFLPVDTGFAFWDEWGALIVHGLILIIEFAYAILPFMRWWNAAFTVTTKRVEMHWGVLYRQHREIALDRIVSVSTERGILDRIFRCGTLVFHDAASVNMPPQVTTLTSRNGGNHTAGVRFHDVPRVEQVRVLVDSVRFGQ